MNVVHDQARRYCAWVGGRLPSAAELIRAAIGDDEVPKLAEAAVDCFTSAVDAGAGSSTDSLCGRLSLLSFGSPYRKANPLYRVRRVPEDIGPFGHVDLFGSVFEWTRSAGFGDRNQFCALADGTTDFATPEQELLEGGHNLVQWATTIFNAVHGPRRSVLPDPFMSNSDVGYYFGFRCAFDERP